MEGIKTSVILPGGEEIDTTEAVQLNLLEGKIKDAISDKKRLSAELRKYRKQYKDVFENDKEWKELNDSLAEIKLKMKKRELALRDESVQALEDVIDEKSESRKDVQLTLSHYLKQWSDKGNNYIVDNEGNNLEVVVAVRTRKAK